MSETCKTHRELIPKALLGDLNSTDQNALDGHLKECVACRKEWETYATTLQEMRSLEDAPVPRHFFVHADARSSSPWQWFRQLTWGCQAAVAMVLLVLCVGAVATAVQLQLRSQEGILMVRFGGGSFPDLTPPDPIDMAAWEARILTATAESRHAEDIEWVRALRKEITQSNLSLTAQQNILLTSALTELETRLAAGIADSANEVENQTARALNSMYRTISMERQEELSTLSQQLTRLAIDGELKNNQTDAILETLLQVAELRLTDTPGGQQ